MTRVVLVHELLPRLEPGGPSDRDLGDYEAALHHFLEGRWNDARGLLEPLRHDGPSQALIGHIREHGGRAPDGWNGVIVAATK
jgi:hypothetical protein